MQDAAGGGTSVETGSRDDSDRSIASDLAALIEHVQASMRLIESAIARETSSGSHDIAANIIVLDDVTPRYMKAGAALKACDAGLGIAFIFCWMRGRRIPGHRDMGRPGSPAAIAGRPVRSPALDRRGPGTPGRLFVGRSSDAIRTEPALNRLRSSERPALRRHWTASSRSCPSETERPFRCR
jgi:hypothetical protein